MILISPCAEGRLSGLQILFMHIDRQQNKLARLAQIVPYMLIAISLAVVFVFILLAQYSHPSSDDFCMASGVNELGLFRQLWEHYFEWSGRYTANALYAVYPVLFDLFAAYKYIPALVILGLFLAMAFFLSSLFKACIYNRAVLLSSLCFVSIFLLGMISPASIPKRTMSTINSIRVKPFWLDWCFRFFFSIFSPYHPTRIFHIISHIK